MLEDCKVYFQHFLQTPSCFNDLKPIVCGLPPEELVQFQHFMAVQAKDFTADLQKRIDDGAVSFLLFARFLDDESDM